ncbi:conserved hypothetical protein [Formosa agariphila KMM 3901]|uniref:Lipocalin-like domain-containing protein n=1 Tax=Formosa agariphila (strain DSM 15362 / KCTC 12365 / LMG 23005 / KMM 3901 / M-2Alg 35-1) TaxID=1347342 RepID=T2KKS3_FORAG|nr:hypothetical protein [Formosa agariphila]CDF79487.1 conserved hypothetical protein [Formosa agariphila KMM 3901]
MNIKTLLLIGLLVTAFACHTDDDMLSDLEGTYVGIFEREGITSQVELDFDNGTYIGESDTDRFPAICHGTYNIANNSLHFENLCYWTADFDWTLILYNNWTFTLEDNVLILTNSIGDTYTLTKQ